jgi:hypothetical protein
MQMAIWFDASCFRKQTQITRWQKSRGGSWVPSDEMPLNDVTQAGCPTLQSAEFLNKSSN